MRITPGLPIFKLTRLQWEMGFRFTPPLQDPYPNFNLPLNSPLGSSQFFSNSLNCAIVCYNRNIICNFRMKTDHTVSVNIKLNQVLLTVINVYFSPHGDFSEAINQLNLYKGINKNCLLAGDFNARSAVGNPDLTLTSCDLVSFVENWEILSTESLSDHSFISVHLRCDLIFSDFVFKTKYGINKFIYNFRKNYNLLNSFLTNISSIELLDDFASLLINTTNASAFSTLRKRRVLNTPSFKWWNNSLRIQRNQLNAYKRRVVSLTTHGMSVDEIASMHSRYKALRANYKKSIIDTKNKAWEYFCSTNSNNFGFTFKAAFGKLSSPTNLHQISTGDPASLFHSKVSLLLDSHFPSGSSPIPLVFNDCSPPSCLSPSEVEVVFRKLRGGKAPDLSSAFRENRSCIEAVDKLVHHIKNTRVNKHTASTFIDIKSAFDNVDWSTLFHIFHSYRIPLHFQKFIHSYLTNRVIIWTDNTFTIKKQIFKGCPQGSVLSPTLWNIYFNPILSLNSELFLLQAFADDLAIVSFGLSRKKLEDNTNKILSLVNSKLSELNLSIATAKTVSVVFRCPFIQGRGFRGSTTFRRNPIFKIGSNSIHISKSYKYLGVNIDNRLSWTPHINSIKDKILWISSNFYRVSKNFNHQHISLMKLWYTSVVQPIISYGAGVWGGSLTSIQDFNSVFQAEFSAIGLSVCWAVHHNTKIHIYTDSLSSILFLNNLTNKSSYLNSIKFKLFQFRSYYNLYWVKAHNNNLYNDYADFYAKQAVYDGEVFSVPAPRSFLSSSLNKFILESWTSSWNDCNTGLRVKRFFNNPKLNILPISKYLVHFLTNHGPFPAYLHRFNLLPSPNCLCGSPGDADHYVFHCPFTSDHHLVNPSPNALYPWVNSIINNRAIHNKLISCFAISKSICDNLA
ncbi:putative 115 kDa protein in type-1 retrotransposable element R1DM [Trichonephila clavipes]|nr:putative 115 kDa protein in type-1 retrotransposable element R1DM [Trichonephila clavipes]